MNVFLLDLWHDLREKRLAPVAILLALALLAVPVLLLKSRSDAGGGATPSASGPPGETQGAAERALTGGPGDSSRLDIYSPHDPFDRPFSSVSAGDGTATVGGPTAPDGAVGAGTGAGDAGGDASVASGGGSTDAGGGSGGSAGAPSDGGGGVAVRRRGRRRTTLYTYVAVVEFGKRGFERRRKLRRLQILPSARNPLLVFLGVDSSRERAVFLLDSTSSQAGRGVCKPSVRLCTFLYLSTKQRSNLHFVTAANGQEYIVKLLDIRRERVRRKKRRRARSSRRARRVPARHRAARVFESLLFTDEAAR